MGLGFHFGARSVLRLSLSPFAQTHTPRAPADASRPFIPVCRSSRRAPGAAEERKKKEEREREERSLLLQSTRFRAQSPDPRLGPPHVCVRACVYVCVCVCRVRWRTEAKAAARDGRGAAREHEQEKRRESAHCTASTGRAMRKKVRSGALLPPLLPLCVRGSEGDRCPPAAAALWRRAGACAAGGGRGPGRRTRVPFAACFFLNVLVQMPDSRWSPSSFLLLPLPLRPCPAADGRSPAQAPGRRPLAHGRVSDGALRPFFLFCFSRFFRSPPPPPPHWLCPCGPPVLVTMRPRHLPHLPALPTLWLTPRAALHLLIVARLSPWPLIASRCFASRCLLCGATLFPPPLPPPAASGSTRLCPGGLCALQPLLCPRPHCGPFRRAMAPNNAAAKGSSRSAPSPRAGAPAAAAGTHTATSTMATKGQFLEDGAPRPPARRPPLAPPACALDDAINRLCSCSHSTAHEPLAPVPTSPLLPLH